MQFPKKNKYFVFDIETTSLKRTSETLQIACVSLNDISKGYNVYSTSEGQISPSASKVNNLTTAFQAGKNGATEKQSVSCSLFIWRGISVIIPSFSRSLHAIIFVSVFFQKHQIAVTI